MGLDSGPYGEKSWKQDFWRARADGYLDTAAEGLPPASAGEALGEYYRIKSSGSAGRRFLYEEEQAAREDAACLLAASSSRVALLSSASEGLNLLANSFPWREGDEVLISDLEFSSNVVAWLRLRTRGVVVRLVPTHNGIVRLEDFAAYLNGSTRVVSVSQVSYKTGTQIPFLPQLSHLVHEAGAILCVDATQAMGRVPVSVEGVDFLVASSYKWLLGVHGIGVVYLSPQFEEQLTPAAAGWYSIRDVFSSDRFVNFSFKDGAARLVAGMPNFPSIFALRQGLLYLREAGVAAIDTDLKPVVNALREGLVELGVKLLTPPGEQYASGIVSFAHAAAEEVGRALEEQGVTVWAGDGRVRASVHLYNELEDVKRLLSALSRILTQREIGVG